MDALVGQELYETLTLLTGLPEDFVRREFSNLITKNNLDINTLTVDDVRNVLADFLQDTLLSLKTES